MTDYSDGYELTMTQTIATTPASSGPTFNGMCFAVDDPDDSSVILGGFCVNYTSLDTETDNASIGSRTVTYISPSLWDGNYTSSVGETLTALGNLLVMDPDVTSSADATGNSAGETIAATWYQPTSADVYTSLIRVSAGDTVMSYSITPSAASDGDALGSCSSSSYTLTGSMALATTAVSAAVLAALY
jgi:hypothetical protein